MGIKHKRITYVINATDLKHEDCCDLHNLSSLYDSELKTINTLHELFPLLSDPNFSTDLIAIELAQCYINSCVDVFDITNALNTLIKSTSCFGTDGQLYRRTTKLFLLVHADTPITQLKEAIGANTLGIMAIGANVNQDEKVCALHQFISGCSYVPKRISDCTKVSKHNKCAHKKVIELTAREQQIVTLIRERGVSNKVIAKILNISESTVKLHISKAMKKFGARNRMQLILFSKGS